MTRPPSVPPLVVLVLRQLELRLVSMIEHPGLTDHQRAALARIKHDLSLLLEAWDGPNPAPVLPGDPPEGEAPANAEPNTPTESST